MCNLFPITFWGKVTFSLLKFLYTRIYECRNILSHLLWQVSNFEPWTFICGVWTLVIQWDNYGLLSDISPSVFSFWSTIFLQFRLNIDSKVKMETPWRAFKAYLCKRDVLINANTVFCIIILHLVGYDFSVLFAAAQHAARKLVHSTCGEVCLAFRFFFMNQ